MEYVDLGLPSKTLWASENESGYFAFDEAKEKFKDNLPTKEQFQELWEECEWQWSLKKKGMVVIGPNGKSIFLPAAGYRGRASGAVFNVGVEGSYWSACSFVNGGIRLGRRLFFLATNVGPIDGWYRADGCAVRCVRRK